MTKRIFMLAVLGMALLGCSEEETPVGGPFGAYTSSFVMGYQPVDSIRIFDVLLHTDGTLLFRVGYEFSEESYAYNSQDAVRKAKYDELCSAIGDTTYSRWVYSPHPGFSEHVFALNSWKKIDLVSDRDFDAQHPAGTSLADITQFYSTSPLPYIRSGYERLCEIDQSYREIFYTNLGLVEPAGWHYPVVGSLSGLNEEQLTLLGTDIGQLVFLLNLTKNPDKPGLHWFTLTCTDTEGNVFTDKALMRFPIE